jgi:hypothetical protein
MQDLEGGIKHEAFSMETIEMNETDETDECKLPRVSDSMFSMPSMPVQVPVSKVEFQLDDYSCERTLRRHLSKSSKSSVSSKSSIDYEDEDEDEIAQLELKESSKSKELGGPEETKSETRKTSETPTDQKQQQTSKAQKAPKAPKAQAHTTTKTQARAAIALYDIVNTAMQTTQSSKIRNSTGEHTEIQSGDKTGEHTEANIQRETKRATKATRETSAQQSKSKSNAKRQHVIENVKTRNAVRKSEKEEEKEEEEEETEEEEEETEEEENAKHRAVNKADNEAENETSLWRAALLQLSKTTDPLPMPAACVAFAKTLDEPERLRAVIEAMTEDPSSPFDSSDVHAAQLLLEEKTADAKRAQDAGIVVSERAGKVATLADACNRRWTAIERLVSKGVLNHNDDFFSYLLTKLFEQRRRVIESIWDLGSEYA